MKPYVGIKFRNEQCLPPIYSVFKHGTMPTTKSHGKEYGAVIGPFRTMRGAKFMALYGHNNPHLQTVSDAERIAKTSVN